MSKSKYAHLTIYQQEFIRSHPAGTSASFIIAEFYRLYGRTITPFTVFRLRSNYQRPSRAKADKHPAAD